MEIIISVGAKAAEYLVAPIGRQFSYLLCYNKNFTNFQSQVEKLEEKKLEVQEEIDVANRKCERIRAEVTTWMERANKNQANAKEILDDDEKFGKSCLNIKSRYRRCKKASKLTKDLVEIIAEGKFEKVATSPEPVGLVHTPPNIDTVMPPKSNGSSGEFESRSHILRDIMISLKDDKVQVIGIWGMGGVGKTTMANEVVNRVKKDGIFDEVAMVTVSQKPDLKKLQDDIAEQLGLRFDEQYLPTRASSLHQRLTQLGKNNMPKKILIILDDVWARLDLSEVGIPYANDNCKILLTSRNKGVCDQMRTDRTHLIEVLTNKEAGELFHRTAGVSYDATYLFPIANDIVRECQGLPIAITTIATVLQGRSRLAWEMVLDQLKESTLEGEYASVYAVFGVSYDFLTSEEVKQVFLLCCLFPEDFDIPVEELVRYGIGRKLFKKVNTLHKGRKRGHVHVEELQKSTLLLQSNKADCVKVHDLVRDFALSTASKGEFLVKVGDGIKKWPTEDVNECYTSISLQCNEMDVLPGGLKYPNLKILLLAGLAYSMVIFPESFFEEMRKVEVLVLKYVSIKSLPRSLQFLTSLRTLSLNHCKLEGGDLSVIGELAVLEILSFAQAEIEDVPVEIGKLSRLRLFDLRGCRKVQSISPGIIEGLLQLEELYLRSTCILWAEQVLAGAEGSSVGGTHASFSEVASLSSLIVLEIDIPYEVLPVDLMFLKNLERFYVCVGGTYEIKIKNVFQNVLCCKVDKCILLGGISHVLGSKTEILYMNVTDMLRLPQEYSELGDLRLESCDGLLSLINIVAPSSMKEMAVFGKLRSVVVKECHKLKSIVSVYVVKSLGNLEKLEVGNCEAMEEVFAKEIGNEDEEAGRKIVLIRLQSLKLSNLPNLVCFCKASNEIELPQLEKLDLANIPRITSIYSKGKALDSELPQASSNYPFFVEKINTNKMAKMKLKGLRDLKEIWAADYDGCLSNLACGTEIEDVSLSESTVSGFYNLKEVQIETCPRLHNVFPLSIASGLDKLNIDDCGMVDSIIRNSRRKITKIQFLHLKELDIRTLDNLVDFCTSCEEVEFPQLENVNLSSLPKFHGFASKGVLFDTKQVPMLRELIVSDCDSIEVVFDFEMERCNQLITQQLPLLTQNLKNVRHVWSKCPRVLPTGSLQNLRKIRLSGCDNLRYVFTPSIAKALVGLERLRIEKCMDLEAIVAEEEDDKKEGSGELTSIVLFPQLKDLSLKELPKLKMITPEPTYRINFSSCENLELRGCDITTVEVNTNIEQSLACTTEIEVVSLLKSAISNFHNLEEVGFPLLEIMYLCSQPKFDGFASKGVLYNIKQVPRLRYLIVKECESIEVVFDFEMERCNKLITQQLPLLTRLHLLNLKNVRHVWSKCPRVLPTGSLQNLREIWLSGCDNLRYVFTPSIAKALVGLEELEIKNCTNLEAIVAEEEDDKKEGSGELTSIVLFPQLKDFSLKELPKLKMITPEPTYRINFSSCKKLELTGDITTVEVNTNIEQSLACTTEIDVASLLKSAISNFHNLKEVGFPLLETMRLFSQPKFDGFASKGVLYNIKQVPMLHELIVRDCDSIEVVFDFEMERCNQLITQQLPLLTQLYYIHLSNLKNVRHVWSKCPRVLPTGSLQNLRALYIWRCDNLRYVLIPSIAKALVGLEDLSIWNCMNLEAIVAEEEEDDKMEGTLIILFPQLKTLSLKELPNLQVITPEPTYCINVSSCRELTMKGCGKLNKTLMADTILEKIHALEEEDDDDEDEEEEEEDDDEDEEEEEEEEDDDDDGGEKDEQEKEGDHKMES